MNQLNIPSTITLKKDKVVAHHISDGSELIPSEIQLISTPEGISKCLSKFLEDGYVIDDEGIINNYAIEPDLYTWRTIPHQNSKSVMSPGEQEPPYLLRSR